MYIDLTRQPDYQLRLEERAISPAEYGHRPGI